MRYIQILLFAALTISVTALSQELELTVYPASPDTQYITPGEQWYAQYGVGCAPEQLILSAQGWISVDQTRANSRAFQLDWDGDYRATQDTFRTWTSEWLNDGGLFRLRYLADRPEAAVVSLWLFSVQADMHLPIGQTLTQSIGGHAVGLDNTMNGFYKDVQLVGIDGICGDPNRDGYINKEDISAMIDYFDHHYPVYDYVGRYTLTGTNYGLGRVLFSSPDEISLELLNLWVHNPHEPMVQGLGIGYPFSQHPSLSHPPTTYAIAGDAMTVQSTGNVINITGRLVDGSRWQKTVVTNGASISIPVPSGASDFRVEAVSVPSQTITGLTEHVVKPSDFTLSQNYPNPFNPTTTINFSLPKEALVSLRVYNILGQEVATLVNERRMTGSYTAVFDATNLANGTYIYRLTAGEFVQTKKMALLK